MYSFFFQQAKEMVLDLIRDQGGFREVRNEYGSRIGGNEGLDVSMMNILGKFVL